jgi:hypothetical protein
VRAAKKADEARNQVIEGYAAGNDDAAIRKLEKAHADAVNTASRLTDAKLVGVQRAQQRAEADRLTFVAQNYEALLDERRPAAEQGASVPAPVPGGEHRSRIVPIDGEEVRETARARSVA